MDTNILPTHFKVGNCAFTKLFNDGSLPTHVSALGPSPVGGNVATVLAWDVLVVGSTHPLLLGKSGYRRRLSLSGFCVWTFWAVATKGRLG